MDRIFNLNPTVSGGDVYVDVNINVDHIENDYDVDRLVDRVKDDIYTASTYRNLNVITNVT